MSRPDDPKVPKPPPMRAPSFPRVARPGRLSQGPEEEDEEDVADEATWVARAGPPMVHDQKTSEAPLFDERDGDHDTNIDWNAPSSPIGEYEPRENTLSFDRNTSSGMQGESPATDYPTEPGFSSDGSLSALRDAMRSNPVSTGRGGGTGAPLPIPAPRALTNPGVRPIPPIRRAGNQPAPARVGPEARPPVRRTRTGRKANPLSVLGPVILAAIVVLFVAAVTMRAIFSPSLPDDVAAPMLPVVGGPAPKSPPAPPFDVAAPQPYLASQLAGETVAADEIPLRIVSARAAGNPSLAAAWSDKLVRMHDTPSLFFTNAELLSEMGETNAAFYWLVRAVQEHGVPPVWLVERSAFRYLWADPRWDDFVRWTIQSARHHAARGASPATIILPTNLEEAVAKDAERLKATSGARPRSAGKGATPTLPTVIWLDEIGGNGSSVLIWGQELADAQGVLIVGLGGPERIGPAGSWWTGDADKDRQHIDNALSAIPNAKADPSRIYLVGAGQGAQYAVELMLRSPDFARAGLAMSPTDDWHGERDKKAEGRSDRTQSIVLASGGLVPDTHTLIRLDRGRLLRAGIEVDMQIENDPWPHLTPTDVADRIPAWIASLLSPEPKEEPTAKAAAEAE